MSEIRVNTLKVRSGAEQQGTKAYLSLKQDDQTTHKSFNISGTTDDGAGTNSYTFTNNMADDVWLSVGAAQDTGNYWGFDPYPGDPDVASHQTSGSLLQVARQSSHTTLPEVADLNIVNLVVFGDVA
tara:strand:+ start:197 stop:577 length:381 start_codon:yes stop_codon:yes gene_type:complete